METNKKYSEVLCNTLPPVLMRVLENFVVNKEEIRSVKGVVLYTDVENTMGKLRKQPNSK